MLCPGCGKENTDNLRWCCWCGALFDPPANAAGGKKQAPRGRERKRAWLWVLPALLVLLALLWLIPPVRDLVRSGPVRDGPEGRSAPGTERPGPVQAGTPASAENWSEAYRRFVLEQNVVYEDYGSSILGEKSFKVNNLPFFKSPYSEPRFSLHDMDGGGVPELVIFNGAPSLAGAFDYVFTCRGDELRYLGAVGFRGCELFFFDSAAYPGLFCSDGAGGEYQTEYYTLTDGELDRRLVSTLSLNADGGGRRTRVTEDEALFRLSEEGDYRSLAAWTIDELRAGGWDAFTQAALSP